VAQKIEMVGRRFGRWLVLRAAPRPGYWVCRCDCPRKIVREVSGGALRSGRTCSCGCGREKSRLKHGMSRRGRRSPEYIAWRHIIHRCEDVSDPRFYRYGARGINICPRWRNSFEHFLLDVGCRPTPQHSIHRIDNDGDYRPGNVRWATKEEQAQNKQRSIFATLPDGRRMCFAAAVRELGLPYGKVIARYHLGWTPEQALQLEARPERSRKTIWVEMLDRPVPLRRAAGHVGVSHNKARALMRGGWSAEQALGLLVIMKDGRDESPRRRRIARPSRGAPVY
jgi:hypothetical protein